MLALLRALGPVTVLLLGFASGGALLGGVGWLYNVLIDNPQVAREAATRASDACAIRVADAALRAEAAEHQRQLQISADALAAWRAAADAQEQRRRIVESQLDQERTEHEVELRDAGRSCVLGDGDYEWLRRQPGGAPAGTRR